MKTTFKWYLFLVIALVMLLTPQFITNVYYQHIINLVGIYTLITIGLNILSGYTGQVSMGHAGYYAIGTYVSSLLMLNLHMPFWLSVLIAVVAVAICGLVVGIPAMKLSGPYLVLATVGFGEIVRLVILNWTPVTKGAAGLTGIPLPRLFGLQITGEKDFFYLIFFVVLIGCYIAQRIARSKIGRTYMAIREDELAAEAMGVPVNTYKISAFVISAIYAGIAGCLFGAYSGVASPDNFTFDDSVGFLCMSVVGGNNTIIGALIGSFVLTILSELLRVFQSLRLILYGLILIMTVIYMPKGLAGFIEPVRKWMAIHMKKSTLIQD